MPSSDGPTLLSGGCPILWWSTAERRAYLAETFDACFDHIARGDRDHRAERAGHDDIAGLQRPAVFHHRVSEPDRGVERIAHAGCAGAGRDCLAAPDHG